MPKALPFLLVTVLLGASAWSQAGEGPPRAQSAPGSDKPSELPPDQHASIMQQVQHSMYSFEASTLPSQEGLQWGSNYKQGYRMLAGPAGMLFMHRPASRPPEPATEPPSSEAAAPAADWYFGLNATAWGYGEVLNPVPAGELHVEATRLKVRLQRSSIGIIREFKL
ncbi:MAG: hypothetical protein HS116_17885 [Planctomycetes bacterium]|nr:hypothetical protein [Planctomycetota bacterium]